MVQFEHSETADAIYIRLRACVRRSKGVDCGYENENAPLRPDGNPVGYPAPSHPRRESGWSPAQRKHRARARAASLIAFHT